MFTEPPEHYGQVQYYVSVVYILGEADVTFCTTEITSQFKEAFPVLYAEYDEQETSKKKRKPKKKTRGMIMPKFCKLSDEFCSFACPYLHSILYMCLNQSQSLIMSCLYAT